MAALMLPRSIMGFVLQATGWHQACLAFLSAAVFLLSAVPLEIQRRIVNDLTEKGRSGISYGWRPATPAWLSRTKSSG